MKYAVVDTGSNTIRMSIYEYEDKKLNELFTEAVFANLAGYILDNRLTDDGIKACSEAILKHKETAKEYKIDKLYVFATAAIRNAENAEEIVSKVKENTGITMQILSGDDEGELSFLGACSDFTTDSGIMADVGGGSSEVIAFENGKIKSIKSVPIGSLKAYKMFVSGQTPTEDEIKNIKSEIKKYLDENKDFKDIKTENLCLVGGGVRAARKLSEVFLNKETLDVASVNFMISLFLGRLDIMKILEKTVPERKLTITPGLAIYSAIGEYFSAKEIQISDKGIKEGYVLKYLINQI